MNEHLHISPQGMHFLQLAEGADVSASRLMETEYQIHLHTKRKISQPLFDVLVSLVYSVGASKCKSVFNAINQHDEDEVIRSWMKHATAKDPKTLKRRGSELQYLGAYHAQQVAQMLGPFVWRWWHWVAPTIMAAIAYGVHEYIQRTG